VHLFTPILAADYARDRQRDADQRRLATLVAASRTPRTSPIRRFVALGLVAVSRASAAAVRRLDACIADDLGRALAPTDGV
jgi:hypothetical protein